MKPATSQGHLRLAGLAILVVGLLAALCIYVMASPTSGSDGSSYRIVNGQAYAVPADESGREARELERLGGKATVWTHQLDQWLSSLWHGQRLAYTLGALSLAIALLCFHIAGLMDEDAPDVGTEP
jgi:hypothetical protein